MRASEAQELLIAAVTAAGTDAARRQGSALKVKVKPDGSKVSDGDLAADAILREALMGVAPSFGWFSEESGGPETRLGKEYCWITDPIDGTSGYIAGGAMWCVAAGLLHHHEVIAVALFQPKLNHMYAAARHGGATRNGLKLGVRDGNRLEGLDIMASVKDVAVFDAARAVRVAPQDRPFLLRLALVAEGGLGAVYSTSRKHDWDLAPGALLVSEAGGVVTDQEGKPMQFNTALGSQNGIIAGGAEVHKRMRGEINHGA